MSDLDLIEKRGIVGAGGGKKPKTPPPPKEEPNTLRSVSKGRILDLIAHGPIVGLVDGHKSIFLDDTPLQAADGTYNFQGVTVTTREGYPDQEMIPGFRAVENPISITTDVKQATPVIRTVSNNDADAVVVVLQFSALTFQDKKTGDLRGTSVELAIDTRQNGGAWNTRRTDVVSGKTTSAYQRTYRIELDGAGPWEVRVRRITKDDPDSSTQSAMSWHSMTEVVDARLSYPDSALIGLELDAQMFGNQMPSRAYDMMLSIIKVPSNYDPLTRTYTGLWDGTFKQSWTDNPAWAYYDLATHPVIGAGLSGVDKWALYQIGQYCDELVPDGYGGMEPRFTVNTLFAEREEAITTLTTLASVFRGMTYWGTNTVVPVADMPGDARKLVSPANVVNGEFEYSGTALKERHSVAIIMWNDPNDGFKTTPEFVEDPESVDLFGWREVQVTAFACSSRGQARRLGRWILYSERMETETVTYSATADHADLRPGDYIKLSDPDRAGARLGGRVVTPGTVAVVVDKVPGEVAGHSWFLNVVLPSGTIEQRAVSSFVGNRVNLAAPLSASPVVGAMWVLSSIDVEPPMYRVASVDERDDGTYQITATEHDPNKYAIVEQDWQFPETSHSLIPTGPIAPPMDITVSVFTYLAGGTEHQAIAISWTPSSDARVTGYIAEVWGPNDVKWRTAYNGAGMSFDERDAEPGEWMIRVRAVNSLNGGSGWVSRTVNISGLLLPVAPDSVEVTVGTFEITLRPRGAYPGAAYEFWRSMTALSTEQIESNAVRLSVGVELVDVGLTPDTTYFYYIRGANAYGVSNWYPVQATTENDPELILQVLSGEIRESHLYQVLQERIDLIDAPADVAGSVAARLEEAREQVEGDLALISGEISQVAVDLAYATDRLDGRVNLAQSAADDAAYSLSQESSRLDGRVDEVSAAVTAESAARAAEAERLDGRVDEANDAVSGVSQALADEAARLDGRVDGVATAADTLRSDLQAADAELADRLAAAETAIVNETSVRATADSQTAETLNGITAKVEDNTASIGAIRRVQVEQDALAAVQFEAINVATARAAASIRTEESARADADSALATRTTALEASVSATNAAITTEQQARVDADSALASQLGELSAKVDALPQFASGFEPGTDIEQWTVAGTDSLTADASAPYAGSQSATLTSSASSPAIAAATRATVPAGVTQAMSGFEVVVRVAAKKPATNATAEFAVAYLSASGNSGWRKFAPTANWAEYEFRWTVPEHAPGGTDTLALWADTAGSGKGVMLDSVRVSRASGEIAAVTAAITAEQTARANADAALTTSLNSLTSRVGTAESGLAAEQSARATADDALAADIATVTARVGTAEAGITSEQTARANADAALATRTSGLESRMGSAESAITAEQTARASADSSLTSSLNSLTSRVGSAEGAITAEQTARANADAALTTSLNSLSARVGDAESAITSEQTARTTADTALASDISGLKTRMGSAESAITTEQGVRATADSALATRASNLETRMGSAEAAITAEQTARTTADSALTTSLNGLTARVGDAESSILSEQTARASADSLLAQEIHALKVEREDGTAALLEELRRVSAEGDALSAVEISAVEAKRQGDSASIVMERETRVTNEEVVTTQLSQLTARMGQAESSITSEQTARADADSALSNQISALSASYGDDTSSTVPNPSLDSGSATWTFGQSSARVAATDAAVPAGCPTAYCAKIASRDTYVGRTVPCKAGDRFYASAMVATPGSGSKSIYQIGIGVRFKRKDGSYTWPVAYRSPSSAPGTWAAVSGEQVAPEDAVEAVCFVQHNRPGGSFSDGYVWFVTQLDCRPAQIVSAVRADLVAEQQARADAVSALTSQITALSASAADNAAAIQTEQQARADADGALASQITTLQTQVAGDIAAVEQSISVAAQGGNRFSSSHWAVGTPVPSSLTVAGVTYTPNGLVSEQSFVRGTGPNGASCVFWQATANGGNDADGGWNASVTGVDPLKSLRLTAWVYAGPTAGTLYLGCSTTQTLNLDGTSNTNPYFWSGKLPQAGKWYLLVGVLHGSDYTGGQSGISGLYDPMTGTRVSAGSDFKMKPGTTTQVHRAYQYYAPAGGVVAFYAPRFELFDGASSVQQLLAGQILGGLIAQYGLKLDVNGYVSGIGAYNDGQTSDFAVLADRFYVAAPGTTNEALPFIVVGGQVYMRSTLIQDASIGSAKIANLAITSAKLAGTLQSDNFVAGQTGWRITKTGGLEFNGNVAGGGRLTISNTLIQIFDGSNVLRLRAGLW
ncbi:putative phage tail protein [compost metagenome]